MKMNLKIFNSLSNPVAVQNVNGKDVEIHYMNETEYLEKYTQRGQFFVWTGDGKSTKLLIEKGYYMELNPLFSPKANELRLDLHDDFMKTRRKVYFGLFIPILVIIIAALLVAYLVLGQYQMEVLIGSLLVLLLTNVIQTVVVNKNDEKLKNQYFYDLEELIGSEQLQELFIKQRDYFKNFLNLEDDEFEEEVVEEEVIEEPVEEVCEEPVVVAAPFVEEEPVKEEVVKEAIVESEVEPEPEVEEVIEEEPKAQEAKPEEKAAPVKKDPAPKAAPAKAKERVEGEADLSILTVDELKEFARDRKITGSSAMRKSELVEALPNEFDDLRVVELQALARTLEIPNFSTMRRAELVESILAGKPEVVEEVVEVEYVRVQIVNEQDQVDLSVLTVDELKEFNKERKVTGFSTMRKSELVESLPNQLEELRVIELQALAREHEIPNFSTMRRAELIDALREGKLVEKTDDVIGEEVKPKAAPAPKKEEPKVEYDESNIRVVNKDDTVDLSVLTVDELKEFAKDRKISGSSAMRKVELVEALPKQLEELRLVELQAFAREHKLPHFSTMRRQELLDSLRAGIPVKEEKVVEEPEAEEIFVLNEDGTVNYNVLTTEELKEFARDRKITGFSTMRKAELVEAMPKELKALRVVELQALARAKNVPNFSTMRKQELLEVIK